MNRDDALAQVNEFHRKRNIPVYSIPLLLVASFACFILSSLFDFSGAPEESHIPGVEESTTADTFEKIAMGMRIMPSHNTEGNMLLMLQETGTAEHEASYSSEVAADITETYFTTDKLEDYFPDLVFTENTVPVGTAKPFCLHLDWQTKEMKRILDRYYSVQDLPECTLAKNKKFRWQKSDPRTGLDFALWKQYVTKAPSAGDCEADSIFVPSSKQGSLGTCYRYDVVESVCVTVQFKINEETATYGWSFAGGCFEDGRVANYAPAKPGTEYSFDKLDFEVREYQPGLAARFWSLFSLSGLFYLLSVAGLIASIVLAVLLVQDIRQSGSRA